MYDKFKVRAFHTMMFKIRCGIHTIDEQEEQINFQLIRMLFGFTGNQIF